MITGEPDPRAVVNKAALQLLRAKQAAMSIHLDAKYPPWRDPNGPPPLMSAVDAEELKALRAVVRIVQEEI